jgi:Ni/Co efflux regulator RcnB
MLPTSLIDLLPPPPHGYKRVAIDGKVLLIEIATQVIHDVLEDLILR